MINYHDTQSEINLIKTRLEILNQEKESLETLVAPKSVRTDKANVQTSPEIDKSIVEYIYRLSKVEDEISKKKTQLEFLEQKLKEMEEYLRQSTGLKNKVFVMRYIDGIKVRDIAWKLNYAECYIYKVLGFIDKEIQK